MWLYEDKEFDHELSQKYYGFVYLIENIESGKRYIGRKYFTKASSRQVKGKKKRCRKESDWKDYWGSSQRLLVEIESLGKEKFKRTVLRLCQTRGECNYWEAKLQFMHNVLETDLYYNDNIMMKFTRKNIGSFDG
jgi:hypothetical protein